MENDTSTTQAPAESPADAGQAAKRSSLTKVLPSDRLALDRQIAALRAFAAVFESNGGKAVTNNEAGEVVQPAKMAAGTIVVVNAFFCDIGLLTRQDNGRFMVAPEAVAFLNAEHGLAADDAPEKLRPLFEKQWFMQMLMPRLRLGPQDLQTVYKVIGEGSNATTEHVPRIDLLIEFMSFVRLVRKEGNQVRLVAASAAPVVQDNANKQTSTKAKTEAEEEFSDLERHTLTLDPKTKRRIVVHIPHTISSKELERIKNWLSFQINIEEPSN